MGTERSAYATFRSYLERSNQLSVTCNALERIVFRHAATRFERDRIRILDVGSSDGELILNLVSALEDRGLRVELVLVEPDHEAFFYLQQRVSERCEITRKNISYQKFVGRPNASCFDVILFTHCWYHFPKPIWEILLEGTKHLLRKDGISIVTMDSCDSPAHSLQTLASYKLPYNNNGFLQFAEDLHDYLSKNCIYFEKSYISSHIKYSNRKSKKYNIAKDMSFLYRRDINSVYSQVDLNKIPSVIRNNSISSIIYNC